VRKFQVGDRVIVHTCPRAALGASEVGWTGVIVNKTFDGRLREEGMVWVLIDGRDRPFIYKESDLRLLTPLDLILK
jgi:hypothetical protein